MQDSLLNITRELIALRKKPSTQVRFKQYPALMQQFSDLVDQCDDVATLRQIIELDSGYHLLAWYRQKTIEKWLSLERTPNVLRLYAMQLNLFGDVDAFGDADTDIDDRVLALEAEADALEKKNA
ncbi:MAG: hypothetical protein H6670_02845 [Anaerolineaceae bacterium]|nr:hypothetical protein [Anaerolineaceae bacterium]